MDDISDTLDIAVLLADHFACADRVIDAWNQRTNAAKAIVAMPQLQAWKRVYDAVMSAEFPAEDGMSDRVKCGTLNTSYADAHYRFLQELGRVR